MAVKRQKTTEYETKLVAGVVVVRALMEFLDAMEYKLDSWYGTGFVERDAKRNVEYK